MSNWLNRLLGAVFARDGADAELPIGVPPSRTNRSREALVPSRGATLSSGPDGVDAEFYAWLLGADRSSDGLSEAEVHVVGRLRTLARDGIAGSLIPRVPAVVPQLLQTLRDPAHSIRLLSRQIASDPVLVAAVLQVSNSAMYARRERVESLEQAIRLIGEDTLRHVIATAALRPLINLQSGRFTKGAAPRVWRQTQLARRACRTLAPVVGISAFEAYLAVLLLNVAAIIALRLIDLEYRAQGRAPSRQLCASLAIETRAVAARVGTQWEFPHDVIVAVGQPSDPGSSAIADIMATCDRLGKLRVLVDARVLELDYARGLLGESGTMLQCFDDIGLEAPEEMDAPSPV